MKKNVLFYASVFSLALLSGCIPFHEAIGSIEGASPRTIYQREFKNNDPAFSAWEHAYLNAMGQSVSIPLPYAEKGIFVTDKNQVYSYSVALKQGELLVAQVSADVPQQVFMTIAQENSGSYETLETNEKNASEIQFTPDQTGNYTVVIQPKMHTTGKFSLQIHKKPLYAFPVAGKGNSAIQSLWAQPRDGGKRKHEGIDILAKRGTPVVAVADGTITDAGERGIGGKQVWLRSGLFGNSIYYAHLDQIAVSSGTRVTVGDTLGYVGDTGNAKGGAPHLHFGIYKGYGGAVDPLPYVYRINGSEPEFAARTYRSAQLKIAASKAILRSGPAKVSEKIGELTANETVWLLGQHQDWLHIETATGQHAFVYSKLVSDI